MSQMSNYLEQKLLDAVLRNVPYVSPAAVYVGLFSSDPTDAGGGIEVAGGGYARQQVTFSAPSNPGGVTNNTADIEYPVATTDWGNVTHIGIYDAAADGNLLFYGPLSVVKSIQSSDQFLIKSGNLTVTLQ